MASASMWAFLIFTPPLLLRAYRMRRPELSVQAAAFTSILPTTNLDFPDVLTQTADTPRLACVLHSLRSWATSSCRTPTGWWGRP